MARISGWIELLCLLWLPALWAADPGGRLRLTEPQQFHYRETRHLTLLQDPWQGSGFLLADPDGTLVKLQLNPTRVIMVATPAELLYFDPGKDERRRLPLPSSLPRVQGIVLLQRLLQGRLEAVRRDYDLEYAEGDGGWRLTLSPKRPGGFRRVTIVARGERLRLEVVEAGGDRSVTELSPDERGVHLRVRIARLLQQARGR